MNKYQEALNSFCDHCVEYKEKRYVLQELVDKATPKKLSSEIISKVERDFLTNVSDIYKYIGRDTAGDLWLFENEPKMNDGIFENEPRMSDRIFENNGGWAYKLPDFIAEEFKGIEIESVYMISEL